MGMAGVNNEYNEEVHTFKYVQTKQKQQQHRQQLMSRTRIKYQITECTMAVNK